jgi:hypothetical protein
LLPNSGFDKPLTLDQQADLTGVSARTITNWQAEGLPKKATARQLAHFIAKRPQTQSTGSKKQALAAAQAEKFQLENARRRGELVLLEDVISMLSTMAADLVGLLEGLPGRLANELAGITDAGVIRERLLQECRAIRLAIAESIGKASIPETGGEALERSADAAEGEDADRVGGGELPAAEGKRRARNVPKREDAVPRADARKPRKISKGRRDHGVADGKNHRVLHRHRAKTRR